MGIDFKHSSFARPTFGLNPDKFTEVREIPFNLHALKTNTKFTKPETNTAMQRLTPKSLEDKAEKTREPIRNKFRTPCVAVLT